MRVGLSQAGRQLLAARRKGRVLELGGLGSEDFGTLQGPVAAIFPNTQTSARWYTSPQPCPNGSFRVLRFKALKVCLPVTSLRSKFKFWATSPMQSPKATTLCHLGYLSLANHTSCSFPNFSISQDMPRPYKKCIMALCSTYSLASNYIYEPTGHIKTLQTTSYTVDL